MGKKETKKKFKLDKQSSASIVLSFTMMFFLITMFMATQQFGSSFALVTEAGDTIPDNLTFNGSTALSQPLNYLDPSDVNMNLAYDFKATDGTNTYDMYCIEGQVGLPGSGTIDTYNNPAKMDASYSTGLSWLLNHSYPLNPSTSYMNVCSDSQCKKYLTQYAVWYYLDKMGATYTYVDGMTGSTITNGKQLSTEQTTKLESLIGSGNSIAVAINNLVNDAISHNATSAIELATNASNATWTVDGDYIVSSDISVISAQKDLMTYYTVSVPANVSVIGGELVGTSGTSRLYKVSKDNSFKVKVPYEEVNGKDNYSLTISVSGIFATGVYAYNSVGGYQKPLIPTLDKKSVPSSLTIRLTEVTKSDITNGKPVEGATLVIKNNSGTEVATWVTDANPHYVNLAPGEYTLCETTSPNGYELNTECVNFTVNDDNTITKVEMKNTPTTPVPDTAASIPTYLYLIGAMILVLGGAVIYFTLKPKKNK